MTAVTPNASTRPAGRRLYVPWTRGATSGMLMIVLGVWGAIIPFVGPYFDYGYGPNASWHFTWGHLWLNIIPGVAAIIAGLVLLATRDRASGGLGAWLGIAAGTWFIVGPTLSGLWSSGDAGVGAPIGTSTNLHIIEAIGIYLGLGAVILLLAATALGRFTLRAEGDAEAAEKRERMLRTRAEADAAARAAAQSAAARVTAERIPSRQAEGSEQIRAERRAPSTTGAERPPS